MKNRKTIVASFLVAAALMLGVGYAEVSDVLVINGTADITAEGAQSAFNADVYFSAAEADHDDDIAEIGTDHDMATFTAASLTGKGDKASFTFTITNAGDVNAEVTPRLKADGSGNTQPEWFNIYSDWNGTAQPLNAGDEIDYTVTVELLKTPTTAITGSFHIELTAVSIATGTGTE